VLFRSLGGPSSATSTEDRLGGFRVALRAAGLRPTAVVYGPTFSYRTGFDLMVQLLERFQLEAVFCGDDILAIGAIDACRAKGISVPGDIGVLGFDDMPIASWAGYNLSTVRQPISEVIVSAVELLMSIIREPDRNTETKLFPCEQVVRGTLREVEPSTSRTTRSPEC